MPDILEQNQIPYEVQAGKLFNLYKDVDTEGRQQIIPFLGAGVSISERAPSDSPAANPNYPSQDQIASVIATLGLQDRAGVFMEMAILLASQMQAAQAALPAATSSDSDTLLGELNKNPYPPSAGELAQYFSDLAKYSSFQKMAEGLRKRFPEGLVRASDAEQVEMLKLLSKVTEIANPPDPLTSITNYFENKEDRKALWIHLKKVISRKEKYTGTHHLIAAAAKLHLEENTVLEDYLVITTNYDCLMEKALDQVQAPYVVLVAKNSDHKVMVRFAPWMAKAKELSDKYSGKNFPSNFTFQEEEKLVVIYKIHGCVYTELSLDDEGVVISDDDYVNYVTQMGTCEGAIPAHVNSAMQGKPFLFLGYSLNDWNVRSIFETLRKQRNPNQKIRDFSVMRSVRDFEKIFFDKNNVQIFRTDLKKYIEGLLPYLSREVRERFWGHGE